MEQQRETNRLLKDILRVLHHRYALVTGGTFTQLLQQGETTMLPIQPGNSPQFQVAPTFSEGPIPTLLAQAAVTSSDTVNAPVELNVGDPTGLTFTINLTPGVTLPTGGESLTISWIYTNLDGTTATVSGTLTEEGLVSDVTGGTFAQIL